MKSNTFNDRQEVIINYLKTAYDNAYTCDDINTMLRVTHALYAFKQDINDNASENPTYTCGDCVFYDDNAGTCNHYSNALRGGNYHPNFPSCASFLRRMPAIKFKTKTVQNSYNQIIDSIHEEPLAPMRIIREGVHSHEKKGNNND